MGDRDGGEIEEWLLLPSSDQSDNEFLEEDEDELNFDRIFNQELQQQLDAEGIIFEEVTVTF